MRVVRHQVWLAAIAAGVVFLAHWSASAADAEKGKTLFVTNGCWQCHGFMGQGGSAGKRLAPDPMPFEAMNNFVRNTNGRMPPYHESILSDSDLAEIHAFLSSVKAPDPKSIPILQPVAIPAKRRGPARSPGRWR